uniref:Toll-like receptor 22 n=1 Tax=Myripristis murdjan TaxID=586833 RepID=A0A667YF51_9TELE
MGPLFLFFPPVLLLSLLPQPRPSQSYSLKHCTIAASENASADVSVDCSNGKLVAVPDDIPRHVTTLALDNNKLTRINQTDFRYLSRLRVLTLTINDISQVDDGAFVHLVALRELSMAGNDLENITDNMFIGLSNLSVLQLTGNIIEFISPSAFDSLLSLRVVMLDSNSLYRMADILPILRLPNIEELYIQNNELTTFQSADLPFNTSSNLRALNIFLNPLKNFSVTADVFPRLQFIGVSGVTADWQWDVPDRSSLSRLTMLAVGGTQLSFAGYRSVLQSADSVQDLTLSDLKEWIDKGILDIACQIPALRTFVLGLTQVEYVDDKILASCSQLTSLDLSINGLTKLYRDSLSSMKQLRNLRLTSNHLSETPAAVRVLSKLEVLDLGFNDIGKLSCSDFFNLTHLEELYLNHNNIDKLSECIFQNLNNLKVLSLAGNFLITCGDAFKTGLQKLESLDLSGNYLKKIRNGDFRSLSSLKSLNLESNTTFADVDNGAFKGLDKLLTLSLSLKTRSYDVITGLQHLRNLSIRIDFPLNTTPTVSLGAPLPSLKRLRMSSLRRHFFGVVQDLLVGLESLEHCAFENFHISLSDPDTFKQTPRLKTLRIVQTDLSDVSPELFWQIPNLEALDFSDSKLKSLDFLGQANLSRLTWLKVSESELTVINETVFRFLPALTYLDMIGNPFTCDCSNSGFSWWIQNNNQTQVANGHRYACAYPLSKKGSEFLNFDIRSCWLDASFLCYICTASLTVLTLLTSFIYHFLRWQLVYAYYLFLAFLYDSRKRRKGPPHHYDAFVSYNVHDEAWVYGEMLPALEGEQGWRLCLHHRDFTPGRPILENITEAIYSSRKTLCVISRHYLQSEWCSREIQMASFRLFDEQQDVLVLLFLEEIPAHQLSPYHRMRKLLRRRSYLSWPQGAAHSALFWHNVGRALRTDMTSKQRTLQEWPLETSIT